MRHRADWEARLDVCWVLKLLVATAISGGFFFLKFPRTTVIIQLAGVYLMRGGKIMSR